MMFKYRKIKLAILLMASLVLFQSCRVYHKANVSIDEAVKSEKRARLMTKEGEKLKFIKIIEDNGNYYGLKFKSANVLIQPDNIDSLRLHDRTMSIIYGTIIAIVGLSTGFILIWAASWSGPIISGPIYIPM